MNYPRPRPNLYSPLKVGDYVRVIKHDDEQTRDLEGQSGYIERIDTIDLGIYCYVNIAGAGILMRYGIKYFNEYVYEIELLLEITEKTEKLSDLDIRFEGLLD